MTINDNDCNEYNSTFWAMRSCSFNQNCYGICLILGTQNWTNSDLKVLHSENRSGNQSKAIEFDISKWEDQNAGKLGGGREQLTFIGTRSCCNPFVPSVR